MADIFSRKKRSEVMGKVKGKDTRPETKVRSLLHRAGLRFRKNAKSLPGTPDIVLPKYSAIIFVNGCFWHRHDCKQGNSMPENNKEFWKTKFLENIERDKIKVRTLEKMGWRVFTLWECELKKEPEENIKRLINRIKTQI